MLNSPPSAVGLCKVGTCILLLSMKVHSRKLLSKRKSCGLDGAGFKPCLKVSWSKSRLPSPITISRYMTLPLCKWIPVISIPFSPTAKDACFTL